VGSELLSYLILYEENFTLLFYENNVCCGLVGIVVLSAKYDFVDPDFIIHENYDVTFKDPRTNPVKVELLRRQAERMGLDEYDKIVVLGGKDYIDVVAKVFPASKLIASFKGLPLGKMMQTIKKAIITGEPYL